MKVRVIKANGYIKRCPNCNKLIWRKSKKSKMINKIRGVSYELLICDNCGYREEFNKIAFSVTKPPTLLQGRKGNWGGKSHPERKNEVKK